MQKLYIGPTSITPEILFSPRENIFRIKGTSSPEDVRALYYPVIEWIRLFVDEVIAGEFPPYKADNPLKFQTDLNYFNSSSAKFLFDIFTELKRLSDNNIPITVEWIHDPEDEESMEAGTDIASLVGMEFVFITQQGS